MFHCDMQFMTFNINITDESKHKIQHIHTLQSNKRYNQDSYSVVCLQTYSSYFSAALNWMSTIKYVNMVAKVPINAPFDRLNAEKGFMGESE